MKKLFFVFLILSLEGSAQCSLNATVTQVKQKRECQACFKSLEFSGVSVKYNSDCPNQQPYIDKVNCAVDVLMYFSFTSLVLKDIDKWMAIHDSKCTESNSEKHLWKEINTTRTIITENQSYPMSKDWCEVVESIKNENPIAWQNYRSSQNIIKKWFNE